MKTTMKLVLLGVVALFSCTAHAGGISATSFDLNIDGFDPNFPGTVQGGSFPVSIDPVSGDVFLQLTDNPTDSFPDAPGNPGAPFWDATDVTVTGNIDPFVTLSFNVTNTAGTPIVLVFSTALPTGPLGPRTLFGGSISGSLNNSSGGAAATVSPAPGGPGVLWQGTIDGVPVMDLLEGTTVSTFATTNIPTDNEGLPGPPEFPTLPGGPAVVSTIGITQSFLLTPGDTVQFTSTFSVIPVPEPTSAILVGFAGLCLTAAARRRG